MLHKTPGAVTPMELLTEILMWPKATKHMLEGEKARGNPAGHFADGKGEGRRISQAPQAAVWAGLVGSWI